MGVGREWGGMGFENPCPESHESQISSSFTGKCLKPAMQFPKTYSSIGHNAADWFQERINIFQIPVKSFAFQFLPECHSGRSVSKIDSGVLQRKHGTWLHSVTPWTPPCGCAQMCLTLCNPMDCLLCLWDFPGKNTGVGCHFLLQGIFLTQESNLCLLHWLACSLPLRHQGNR